MITALQSRLNGTGISISSASGCSDVKCPDDKSFPTALQTAASADVIVFVMGLDGTVEHEGFDRIAYPCNGVNASVFGLPGCQFQLIQEVTKAMTPNQKAILVLMHGGGVATPSEDTNPAIGA
jgi:hypothetical protein